jgi:SPP1 gp7 family putative phage head morphogenesis protein
MSKEYWRRRAEIAEEAAANKGREYLKSLEKEFRLAEKRIENDILAWYARLAANNDISLAEAQRLLKADELAEFKWSVEEYIKYGKENALNGQWMKQLENASARVHISRLEALRVDLRQEVEALYKIHENELADLVRDMYSDGYYRTAFDIQQGLKIGFDFAPLRENKIDAVISKPWTLDKRTFSDRIWKQKTDLVSSLQTHLTQSVMRGEAPDKAIKAIAKDFDVSRAQAGRLVMTESAYFASKGRHDTYIALGVEYYEILATLDFKTSELCQSLDGEVLKVSEYEAGVTAPPFHPNCRTATAPYFDDEEEFGERAARNADGKTYYVPANMKYAEWKEKFVKPAQEAILKNSPAGRIIGVETVMGVTVKDIAKHFADSITKRGFTAEDAIEALTNPLHVTEPVTDAHGRRSMQFIGNDVTVVYNPVDSVVVTGWRTGKKRRKKYGGTE